jgi:hypothetical protein
MNQVEFRVPRGSDLADTENLIEKICAGHGLKLTRKGSLAKFPRSVHWHYKKCSGRGTLELTLWRERGRIWASIQDGRKAEWIEEELPELRKAIERGLGAEKKLK